MSGKSGNPAADCRRAATFHAVSLPAGVIKACRAQDRWGSGWRGGKYRGDLEERYREAERTVLWSGG